MKKYLLSSNVYKKCLLAVTLIFLTGCTKIVEKQADLIEQDKIQAKEANYRVEQCKMGDISRDFSIGASLYFPVQESLYFPETGTLKDFYVKDGDLVEKGTLLAELTYNDTSIEADIKQMQIEYDNMMEIYRLNKSERQKTLDELRTSQRTSTDKSIAINLKKAEVDYDFFVYDSERNLQKKREELSEIIKKSEGLKMYAPFTGNVYIVPGLLPGRLLEGGTAIVDIQDETVYNIVVESDPQTMRYNAEVILEVPRVGSLKGRVVSDIPSDTTSESTYYAIELLEKPKKLSDLTKKTLKVNVKQFEIKNVKLVSSVAVKNEDAKRYVNILEDKIIKKRYVKTGIFTSEYTQILDGLNVSDTVVLN